jgi:hypothetical protein
VCDSPEQAALYHTLGLMLGASFLTRHLAGLGINVDLVDEMDMISKNSDLKGNMLCRQMLIGLCTTS